MGKLKNERTLQKEVNALQAKCDHQEIIIASLRADILERTTEFVNQNQVVFGLVDFIFDESEVRTLGEAQRKWHGFKKTIDETETAQAAIDELGVEIIIETGRNRQMVIDGWTDSLNSK